MEDFEAKVAGYLDQFIDEILTDAAREQEHNAGHTGTETIHTFGTLIIARTLLKLSAKKKPLNNEEQLATLFSEVNPWK